MVEIDLSTSTLEDVDALLDRPGLPDATVIVAIERLAEEGYFNYIDSFVRREGLSDAVLVKGAELLATAEEPRISAIGDMLANEDLSDGARVEIRGSLVQAMGNMDEMALFSGAIWINRSLRHSSDSVKLGIIEGLRNQGGETASNELYALLKEKGKVLSEDVRTAVEQALIELTGSCEIIDEGYLARVGRAAEAQNPIVWDLLRKDGVNTATLKRALGIVAKVNAEEVLSLMASEVPDEIKLECARLLGEEGYVFKLSGQVNGDWHSEGVRKGIEDALIRGIEVLGAAEEDYDRDGRDRREELGSLTDYGRTVSYLDPSGPSGTFVNIHGVSMKVQDAAKAALQKIDGVTNPLAGDGVQSPKSSDLLAPPKSKGRDFLAERRAKLGVGPKLKR